MTKSDPGLPTTLRTPPFLAALAAIAVLGGGGFAIVALLTGDDGASPAPPPAVAEAPAPVVAPAPILPAPPPAVPKDPVVVRQERARAAAAPMVARLVPSRGRFLITRAIERQAPQVAACFGRPPGVASASLAVGRRNVVSPDSPGVLRLALEPRDGEIRILDAAVEERGTGSDTELACAVATLKGLALEMPGTTPDERVSMLYPLP